MTTVDQIKIEPDKPKKRSDGLALIASLIALVVSGLSLWISHGTAKLQHGQAKPVPTILRALFAPQDAKQTVGDPRARVLILVMRVDKIGVKIKEVTVHPELLALENESSLKACFEELNGKGFTDSSQVFEVNPSDQYPSISSVIIKFPKSCSGKGDWTFVGEATFKGQDDSGQDHEQPALFRTKAQRNLSNRHQSKPTERAEGL